MDREARIVSSLDPRPEGINSGRETSAFLYSHRSIWSCGLISVETIVILFLLVEPSGYTSDKNADCSSLENACPRHDALKFVNANAGANTFPSVRLQHHGLEDFVTDVFLQHLGHCPQIL